MTDIEIDLALALAIGWEQPMLSSQGVVVQTHLEHDRVKSNGRWLYHWRVFSHKDWNVIGPIATKYNMFPYCLSGKWWDVAGYGCPVSYTPQTAIAMAVIKGAK